MTDADKLQRLLDDMPDSGEVECWNRDMSIGFSISWSEKGRGFGEYTFYMNKDEGVLRIDNECDSPATMKRMLDKLVDEHPEEIKKLFHKLVDLGELRDKV